MEAATRIAESLLIRAKSAEVFCGNWYFLAVEPEDDSSRWACAGQGVKAETVWLRGHRWEADLPLFTVRSK